MGQKSCKTTTTTADFYRQHHQLNNEHRLRRRHLAEPTNAPPANCSSSSTSTISSASAKKSNHNSTSNDSGCYSVNGYSPRGSSISSCLFDKQLEQQPSSQPPKPASIIHQSQSQHLSAKSHSQNTDVVPRSKTTSVAAAGGPKLTHFDSRSLLSSSFASLDSLEASLSLSLESSSSSSSSTLSSSSESLSIYSSLMLKKPPLPPQTNKSQAAHILCEQLNQILNMSTKLQQKSQQPRQESPAHLNKSHTANKLKSKLSSFLFSSSVVNNSNINRSHTFHHNQLPGFRKCILRRPPVAQPEDCSDKALVNFLNGTTKDVLAASKTATQLAVASTSDDSESDEDEQDAEPAQAELDTLDDTRKNAMLNSGKMKKYFMRNSSKRRGLFTWNNNSAKKSLSMSNNGILVNRTNVAPSGKEEKVINLIAAKLLSENIELAKAPYTDEMGFCKIPIALVKRYAFELRQNLEVVAKCLETERLNQLEKSRKLGIPNDFLHTYCKCSQRVDNNQWLPCKCDLDTSSMESFLFRLGLPPIYVESLKEAARQQKHITTTTGDDMKWLFSLSQDVLAKLLAAENNNNNKAHMKIISHAIESVKSLI